MRAHLSLQKRFAYFLFSAFAIGSLASCEKESSDYPEIPAARLMAYNLAPDAPAVAFRVGNTPVTGQLEFNGSTGNYVPVEAGDRMVGAFDITSGASVASQTALFLENVQYSTFLLGSNGEYKTVVSLDNNGSMDPTSGKAWVRFVNAVVSDRPNAEVSVGSQTETATFGSVTDFKQVEPGNTTVEILSVDNFETSRSINLEPNKLYTVMFVGVAGSNDPQQALHTRFVVNAINN